MTMSLSSKLSIKDVQLEGKKVLIRVDFKCVALSLSLCSQPNSSLTLRHLCLSRPALSNSVPRDGDKITNNQVSSLSPSRIVLQSDHPPPPGLLIDNDG